MRDKEGKPVLFLVYLIRNENDCKRFINAHNN